MKTRLQLGMVGFLLGSLLAFPRASHAAPSLVTSRAALAGNDFIDWGQLGSNGASVTSPAAVTSNLGLSATASNVAGYFERLDQSVGWGGNFASGDALLWTEYTPGPMVIEFASPVVGAGAQIQRNAYGSFTAQVDVYDSSSTLIGSFTESGDSNAFSDNSAIFIGVVDTGSTIKRIEYSVDSTSADFAINRLDIKTSCGNGTVDPGEQCDDGNTVDGDCCSSSCQYEAATSPCDLDNNVCTNDECDGAGTCLFLNNEPTTTTCEADNNTCTQDHCDGSGTCVFDTNTPSGTPCNADGNLCTIDQCDGSGACVNNSNVSCPPPVPPCEGGQTCNSTTGLCDALPDAPVYTPCEADGNLCTNDVCDGNGACVFYYPTSCQPPNPPCEGGAVCNSSTGNCDPQTDAAAGTACNYDNNDCTIDTCDGSGGCIPQNAPAGTACNQDNNACTIDACDGSGTCENVSTPLGCVDHYLCYKVKPTTAFTSPTVTLANQFETGTAIVSKVKDLCLPADKNGEGMIDATTHQEAYTLKPAVKHTPQLGLKVQDQFGTLTIDTTKTDRLFVPTNKGLGSDPSGPPAAGAANHWECYKLKISAGATKFPKGVTATVADQFETRTYNLKKPKDFCVPVAKDGSPIPEPVGNLMCYQAKGTTKHAKVTNVHTNNQFGTGQLGTIKEDLLCVPALIVQQSPVTEDLTTCSPPVTDTWQFSVAAGQSVHLKADTVDAATAADLYLYGNCGNIDYFYDDNNAACTFPPPGYACPDTTFTASANSTCIVTVSNYSCTSGATAHYSLRVTLDGTDTTLALIGDDQ